MRRVVIVGYGMAGARLADDIRRRDPMIGLTVVGAEPHPAYNRVLLSNVVAGSLTAEDVRLHPADWADRYRIDLRLGTSVTALDPLTLSDGSTMDYDDLVLATGSRPIVPPIKDLRAIAFRGLDDCNALTATRPGARVAVVGGGLLGLEAARGLAGRGVPVTVVHAVEHLMERQLDAQAGAVLARVLGKLGIEFRIGRCAVEHAPDGLILDDGSEVPADVVVVSAGTQPETSLAEAAGLTVANGVVVDDQLRTSDPAIRAIGDCARHPGAMPGLVRPAWEQAKVLADLLTGANPAARYTGTPTVTRLKARDIDLAAMGDVHAEPDSGAEVLRLADQTRGRYAKLVLRDGRVTGAIMLGDPAAAASITQLYDRGGPAPGDRLALLLGRAVPGLADPPDSGLVCQCNTVDMARLVDAWSSGARTVADLVGATRASTGCGTCRDQVMAIARSLDKG